MGIDEKLPEPYEILDLVDGASVQMRVFGWRQGTLEIVKRDTGERKTIRALRIIISGEHKATGPAYWDVTSKLLQVQLEELFKTPNLTAHVFTITKHGVAPSARFSVQVEKK